MIANGSRVTWTDPVYPDGQIATGTVIADPSADHALVARDDDKHVMYLALADLTEVTP